MDMTGEGLHIARAQAGRTAAAGAAAAPREVLTFRVCSEHYAVDILAVQELRSHERPTRLPGAPAFVEGVINLRGAIVPIADMRRRLGCEGAPAEAARVVIVLSVRGRLAGLVVDAVADVMQLAPADIHPPPEVAGDDLGFVTGVANAGDHLLMLADMDVLLGDALGATSP